MKKRKSRVETEEKILEAALSVFSDYGYDGASIQAIAQKADVNGALIIRYFGSKSGLLKAILETGCKLHVSGISCLPLLDDLEEEIARFFMTEIKMDYDHFQFMRVIFMRTMIDPDIESVLASLNSEFGRPELANCLKPFQKRGEIPADMDLGELSSLLHIHGLGIGTTIHFFSNTDRKEVERKARVSAKIFADGLKAAAASHKSRENP